MITKSNLPNVLIAMGYSHNNQNNTYEKTFNYLGCSIKVDCKNEKITYPEDKGLKITRKTTCNFSEPENFVVLECITRLLDKGYRPEHIELEKEWSLGHERKSGFADILVKNENGKSLFIIECKTFGKEYSKEYNNTLHDGGQLFSYWQQEGSCQWLVLYASDFVDSKVEYKTDSIDCSDDNNIMLSAKKDTTIKLYKDAHTADELYKAWSETYEKRFCGDVIFRDDTIAYDIGVKPLRKSDLKDFSGNDKVVNKFEEILRHNNVSDKENAFNRLVALFICKLVDEIQKGDSDEVEFQYKVGTDTYESLQDRLQRLHKEGMEKFMREEIFYVPDDYADNLVQQYTGHKRRKMIEDLKKTLRVLKFYTNNDFAFKDVHNEELFYQNGKILVEVIQLFQNYRIIGSSDVQMLGDLFEQLLNKGFKQNEGQFFTPIPITRFIWDSFPISNIIQKGDSTEYPKIIDYACGAGHFLTQAFEAVNDCIEQNNSHKKETVSWAENKIYGIEKDYRLARVSKISLFMHGAGDGNIIFGDGLENYKEKNIVPNSFDILVANPPYSVAAFKPHLKLKDNDFSILPKISNTGSEIETLFVERISQLVKPRGIAAIVLPSSILNKENESFICARESLLTNFYIRSIVSFGSKTFGATGTNTIVLFLEKFNEPPKRIDLIADSVQSIFEDRSLNGWEDDDIFENYIRKIGVDASSYKEFIGRKKDYIDWLDISYFAQYVTAFKNSSEFSQKGNQKSFSKKSEVEKMKWYNQHFYDFACNIESEKITYFALCYKQTTLVISSPDDNKEQEKFLGYKWSNRKGNEGIQIIKAGGVLYNEKNRTDNNTIAGLIRNCFIGNVMSVPQLDEYYYYLKLQDMLDFSGTSFNKAIKITNTRDTSLREGMTLYKLNDEKLFDVSIGNRVLSTDIVDNGEFPVYSANVFEEFGRINKQNITDFSIPSILWGIDGDWMVNCISENKPFYPTDHCGVLRIKTESIIPEYLAMALQIEGEYEKFSRSNRASTQRIKSLSVQIPEKNIQKDIVKQIKDIDEQIRKEETTISDLSNDVKSKFVEMFGDIEKDENNWGYSQLDEICDVRDGTHDSPKYLLKSDYLLLTSQNFTRGFVDYSKANYISKEDFDNINKRSKVDIGDIIMPMIGTIGSPVIVKYDDNFAIKNVALIKFENSLMVAEYIKQILDSNYFQNKVASSNRGSSRKFVSLGDLRKLSILNAPISLQNEFADYVKSIDKLKFEASKRKESLLTQRTNFIDKHFK